jgi:hypothetical protein
LLLSVIKSTVTEVEKGKNIRCCTVYTVKEKGGKPDRKPYSRLNVLRNPYRKPEIVSRLYPETSTKLYVCGHLHHKISWGP